MLECMINAILGTKLDQSQTFTPEGKRIPVTNVQAGAMAQLTVVLSFGLGAIFLDERFAWIQALGCVLTLAGIVGVVYVQSTPRAVE